MWLSAAVFSALLFKLNTLIDALFVAIPVGLNCSPNLTALVRKEINPKKTYQKIGKDAIQRSIGVWTNNYIHSVTGASALMVWNREFPLYLKAILWDKGAKRAASILRKNYLCSDNDFAATGGEILVDVFLPFP